MSTTSKRFYAASADARLSVIALCGTFLLLAIGTADRFSSATAVGHCLALDEAGEVHLDYLDTLAISSDTSEAALRDSLSLVRTTADSVFHVTDDSTCIAARAALDQSLGLPPQSRPVYVFAVGSFFAVIDPELPLGEWTRIVFFTRAWDYVSGVGK